VKLACPACGARALSPLQKYFLGPKRSVACPSCGALVSVPSSETTITMAPLIALLVLWFMDVVPWFVMLGGVAVTSVLFLVWVPLILKE
jgi:DNA-directed RNA polymerase subunit RPC12/RpoP